MSRPLEFTVLKIQDFKKVVELLWLCNEESVILADSSTVWHLCLQLRYMGTITGIGDIDPLRWPNSHWCSLKVHVRAAFGSNEFAICDSSLIYTVCEYFLMRICSYDLLWRWAGWMGWVNCWRQTVVGATLQNRALGSTISFVSSNCTQVQARFQGELSCACWKLQP